MLRKELELAKDFKVLDTEELVFEFSFNEHRGGDFTNTMHPIFAFGKVHYPTVKWIDKGWGDYYYDYQTK
jgi:hypothetical protein